jgi:hypothetical protein
VGFHAYQLDCRSPHSRRCKSTTMERPRVNEGPYGDRCGSVGRQIRLLTLLEVVVKYVSYFRVQLKLGMWSSPRSSMFRAGSYCVVVQADRQYEYSPNTHMLSFISQIRETGGTDSLERLRRSPSLLVRLAVSTCRLGGFLGRRVCQGRASLVFILESVAPMIGHQKPLTCSLGAVNIVPHQL